MTETIAPAAKMDIAQALSAETARWLVDYYYAVQDYRIQASGQLRAVRQEADDAVAGWMAEYVAGPTQQIEKEIQRALDRYSNEHEAGLWAKSIIGMGPVLTAGLLAHIDIEKAPTVGHIWRFAGLDPTVKWEKKTKRPWNAKLKVLCWKIGDSFCKQSGRAFVAVNPDSTELPERADLSESTDSVERAADPESTVPVELADDDESTDLRELADDDESTVHVERILLPSPAKPEDLYVWLYARRKRQEVERNETGVFAEQAAQSLIDRNIRDAKLRKTYESGKLPPGRLELRARRYAVKLFLSHFHHVLYVSTYNEDPPKPYILTQDEHVHYLAPPNWPLEL
jgi:hypothetical protein